MRKSKFVFFTVLLAVFTLAITNCKKKDDPEPDPECSYVLTQETEVTVDSTNGNSTSTGTTVYTYNSSKKVVKITRSFGGTVSSYDTVIYAGNGEIDSVNTYNSSGTETGTLEYTYSGGKIASIKETGTNTNGAFTRTHAYTYNGSGQLTDYVITYSVGTPETEELQSITAMGYTGGNITSGTVTMNGAPAAASTIEYETTAPNPYKGLNTNPDEVLEMFSANNATTAYANAAPTMPFFNYTYTYQDGRVKTIFYGETGQYSVTNTLTYECK